MWCLNLEIVRSLSRQVSTDEAERAGIWTRVRGIMMMYMACSTRIHGLQYKDVGE